MEENQEKRKPRRWNILVVASVLLSVASIAWSTYSILDLLSLGPIAITVAATVDLIWMSIQYAQHRGLKLMGSRKNTEVAGWISLAALVGLLIWHGISLNGHTVAGTYIDQNTAIAIAVASPFLPLGAKLVMMLAAARFHDPSALTPEDWDELAEKEKSLLKKEKNSKLDERERDAAHQDWLRQQEQEREKARAAAQALLEQQRQEHEREMEKRRQKAEQEAAEAEAKLEAMRADTQRQIEEARLNAELAISEIETQNEIDMRRASSDAEILVKRADLENDLRRRVPITIQGQVERPMISARTPDVFESTVNLNVSSLTPAQERLKRISAAYFVAQRAAPGQRLSQADFSRQYGIPELQVSRALKNFPEKEIEKEIQALQSSQANVS